MSDTSADGTDQIIVRPPEHKTDRGTLGLGVERDPMHGIAISSFIDGEAFDTVYVDDEDVPELVRALTEVALDGE